ncbi:hypothetical protein BH11BAC3_BH11BAC3_35380 [soil metagenome]
MFMALPGLAATFLPKEILNYVALNSTILPALAVQITGALYLGFAVMNWMAKAVLIGGIYARPLAIGNFMHFLVGGLALIKIAWNNSVHLYIWISAVLYFLFAVSFGMVAFSVAVKKV